MRKFKFAKLVRDKIVKGIQEAGNKPVYHILSQEEYIEELKKKGFGPIVRSFAELYAANGLNTH